MKLQTFLNHFAEFTCIAALSIGTRAARADDVSPATNAPGATISAASNALTGSLLSEDPDKAWKEVQKANRPPFPPAEWSTNAPTQQQQDDYYAPKLLKAADLAAEFYTRFPKHPKAPAARELERQLVKLAIMKFDQTGQTARLAALDRRLLSDPNAGEDDKIRIRMDKVKELEAGFPGTLNEFVAEGRALAREYPKRDEGWSVLLIALSRSEGDPANALAKEILEGEAPEAIKTRAKLQHRVVGVRALMAGLPETKAALEKSARDLLRDFPDQDLGYQVLVFVMQTSEPEKARVLAAEIAASSAPERVKQEAMKTMKDLERLNQPLDIKYRAVDGREVNLAAMKDKVVLVDFWATWCGPCMAELPEIKEAYAKYHDQGFEIVGISLDDDKDKLESTLKSKGMTWPQFFDGQGWKNKIAQEYGINSIPAMWLVDRQGKLVDMEGRMNLQEKIKKLLAQK